MNQARKVRAGEKTPITNLRIPPSVRAKLAALQAAWDTNRTQAILRCISEEYRRISKRAGL